MSTLNFFLLVLLTPPLSLSSQPTIFRKYPAEDHLFAAPRERDVVQSTRRLSKPLVGGDGRVYACSEREFFAFEGNGTIAWTVNLNHTCDGNFAPVHGGKGKIFLVAEKRVIKVEFSSNGRSDVIAEEFPGQQVGGGDLGEIIGIAVSTLSSSLYINIKHRGLFSYTLNGNLLWSTGPVHKQFGYRQGCRRNPTDCYFTSVPVIDYCEASIYISNSDGEIYSLSLRTPHYKWIQDFGLMGKTFTITAGNNDRVYVSIPDRALVVALDASTGNVLWQKNLGPLSPLNCEPVVDTNGWISIGSLDGNLYSISPDGILKKFRKANTDESIIQVSPLQDCSGYAVYFSQTQVEEKVSQTVGDFTYISALKASGAVLTLLVPATGSVYWSKRYSDEYVLQPRESDLHNFLLDEWILLAFVSASETGNPLLCRSRRQKLASSCSQASSRHLSIYTGNERAILWFLFFETGVLIVLAALVRFCWIFWKKKKLQGEGVGNFLERRRSLQLKKKAFDRTISELEKKASNETLANEVLEELGNLVKERESIKRKLSTTYSLGRDKARTPKKPLLPLCGGKTRSYSFQDARKRSVTTIFHTLSDTSSSGSSGRDAGAAKGKAPNEEESSSSSEDVSHWNSYETNPLEPETNSKGVTGLEIRPTKEDLDKDCGEILESPVNERRGISLKRRALSSSANW